MLARQSFIKTGFWLLKMQNKKNCLIINMREENLTMFQSLALWSQKTTSVVAESKVDLFLNLTL